MAGQWNSDCIDRLRKLWASGRTASEIAAELGGGITRNAVIGKVHRLGLSGRVSPLSRRVEPKPRISRKRDHSAKPPVLKISKRLDDGSLPPLIVPPAPPLAVSEPGTILDLNPETECRAVLDERSATGLPLYCRAKRLDGTSYCSEHAEKFLSCLATA